MTAGPSGVNETLSEWCFRPFASKTCELSDLAQPPAVGRMIRERNLGSPPIRKTRDENEENGGAGSVRRTRSIGRNLFPYWTAMRALESGGSPARAQFV